MVSFLRRAGRPTVSTLNQKKITAFQSIDDIVIISNLNPRDEHIQTAFQSLAAQYKDRMSFGSLETNGQSTVVCYNNKDDEQSTLSDLTAVGSLDAFIDACTTPLVGEFSRRNEMKYLQVSDAPEPSPL
jgi:protein disulfide-isomerase A1